MLKKWIKRLSISFAIFLVLGLLAFSIIIGAIVSAITGSDDDYDTDLSFGTATVSEKCERYRPLVIKYAKKYEVESFVDVIMAMMMQETGGNSERYPDVMQSSEYAGFAPNTITNVEKSIDYGVQAIRDAMQVADCTHPSQTNKLYLALQGYNYGSGYVSWALRNYGGYSKENAIEFSIMMQAKLGWPYQYGDRDYVEHVLKYFDLSGSSGSSGSRQSASSRRSRRTRRDQRGSSISTTGVDNKEAVEQFKRLIKNWPKNLSQGRKDVIAKGASLIGYTKYAHDGIGSRTGDDRPAAEDCSSFVAWAFQKCGYTDVPYGSTTGTFVTSSNFVKVSYDKLRPGDVGLKNYIATGDDNHVGIYVGKDENGQDMWLHSTSRQGTGSEIETGPRMNYYSNFTIYFRYTGFKD